MVLFVVLALGVIKPLGTRKVSEEVGFYVTLFAIKPQILVF